MPTITPLSTVAAPARTPLAFGLGSVVAWRTGDRWESGVQWSGPTCDPAGGRGGPNCDTDLVIGLPKVLDSGPTIGEADPFVVYGNDTCSLFGSSVEDSQSRANAHLTSREEQRAEQAFWTGDLGNVPNLSGANGYPAPTSAGIHDLAGDALAAVEQALSKNYGSQGVIHISPRTAVLLGKKHLESRGGRLYTIPLGTPVVVGSGYPDEESIIGTPALFGYRSDIFTSSNRPGDLLNRGTNEMTAIAERSYLIGFDPCGVWKATYTGEDQPGGGTQGAPLAMLLGSIPSSPIPDGTDTTIIVQTNIVPADEVFLHYRVNGGADTTAGEMTQVDTHEFVWNVEGSATGPGDSVEVWAVSGTTESNHITIEVT
jgi:hypothetical protein